MAAYYSNTKVKQHLQNTIKCRVLHMILANRGITTLYFFSFFLPRPSPVLHTGTLHSSGIYSICHDDGVILGEKNTHKDEKTTTPNTT